MTRLNQFFRDVAAATRTPEVRAAVKQAVEQELAKGLRFGDGFEASKVNGSRPAAPASSVSTASDGQYVTSLYRELLGRAPDVGGFNAHLAGLQSGMSRDALRQVFLDSAEFKAKAQVPTTEPTAPAKKTGVEQLRGLIAADLRMAGGREATETDYAYWLPKLQGPCDSGYVTSGQLTGVEYYHRRMLGWQAGGADIATRGPYAGSPDRPVGALPSAIDVVGALTSGPSAPTAPSGPIAPSTSSTEQLRKLIAADIRMAGGREATEKDFAYWLPMMQSPCDSGFVTSGQMTGVEYYHRRILGWQAGGSDMAIAGPFAGSPDANGPVPSAVDLVGPLL